MSSHAIDYEALAEEAARGIVRTVLRRVVEEGLPGEHHFYISFDTRAPGAMISKRLRSQYPEEMTIVLQHRFWDLTVLDDRFEVKLTFNDIPEKVVVPFAALKSFFDPSVPFMLSFEAPGRRGSGAAAGLSAEDGGLGPNVSVPVVTLVSESGDAPLPAPRADEGHGAEEGESPESFEAADARAASEGESGAETPDRGEAGEAGEQGEAPEQPSGAEIVELDAFRKKS